jgi:hypothetical protein
VLGRRGDPIERLEHPVAARPWPDSRRAYVSRLSTIDVIRWASEVMVSISSRRLAAGDNSRSFVLARMVESGDLSSCDANPSNSGIAVVSVRALPTDPYLPSTPVEAEWIASDVVMALHLQPVCAAQIGQQTLSLFGMSI